MGRAENGGGLHLDPSPGLKQDNLEALSANVYPGRLIVTGFISGELAVQLYALMGRSEPSRDREFVPNADGVRTVAPGKSEAEMAAVKNADLIYYQAMVKRGRLNVVSNGAQTIHLAEGILKRGLRFEAALKQAPVVETAGGERIDLSTYEPDAPNYTPRINAVYGQMSPEEGRSFGLSIVRKASDSIDPIYRSWVIDGFELPGGTGYALHTYAGDNPDGPLPSFEDTPYPVPLGDDIEETADMYAESLHPKNLAALVVKGISLTTGEISYAFRNGLQKRSQTLPTDIVGNENLHRDT